MPKRKIVDPVDNCPDANNAVSDAYAAGGKPLSSEGEREFLERRATLPVVEESNSLTSSPWAIVHRRTHVLGERQRLSDLEHPIHSETRTLMQRRRGTWEYRERGKGGAGLPMPPWAWRDAVAERDRLAEHAKQQVRAQLSQNGAAARRKRAQELAAKVAKLAKDDTTRGRHKRIARKAGCSVRTVERLLSRKPPRQR